MSFARPERFDVFDEGLWTGPGLTKQSEKDSCDINRVIARYRAGVLDEFVARREAQYMDVPALDFREAMEQARKAESMFMELPSDIRKRFANDPGEFLGFVQDPANTEQLYEMGLAVRRPPVEVSPGGPESAVKEVP